jgi:benzoyl-CoA reductase/2-hydroxyglutaryl-CoA dehydratase subunit BcrC/BadD/HgdB
MDTANCPYLKSCYDLVLKGRYDFLDGWVTPDSCDGKVVLFKIWQYNRKSPYFYWLSVPNVIDKEGLRFFEEELGFFKRSIERFTDTSISDEMLYAAIDIHNEQRALLRELYQLRRVEPPLLSGSEVNQILMAVTCLPPGEANVMLRNSIAGVENRQDIPEMGRARLLLYGPEIDDPALFRLIEGSGGNVVVDDACVGTRTFWHDVEKTGNPIRDIAERYLGKIVCPRVITDSGHGWSMRQADLDRRFGHILDFATEYSVKGVICCIMKWCDMHEYDYPELREYLEDKGVPVLWLETDYTVSTLQALRTRIEAFLEMIA